MGRTLIDTSSGARVAMAAYGAFDLPFAWQDAAGDDKPAYADLLGPNIGAVMARVGWRYSGIPARVDAFLPQRDSADRSSSIRIAGIGWAGPIQSSDGIRGINISYAVAPSFRGAGLARLLAYCAVSECMAHQVLAGAPLPTFVNIQARATNAASLAVARSLGVPPRPEARFVVPENGRQVEYLGFREPVVDFLARGLAPTMDRLPSYDPGALAAARIGIVTDADSSLGLLEWLGVPEQDGDIETCSADAPCA